MFKGFFSRMYQGNPNRPDLNPGDLPKNKFELFFTTLGMRFMDLIKLNMLFVLMMLPLIAWSIINIAVFFSLYGNVVNDVLSGFGLALGSSMSDEMRQNVMQAIVVAVTPYAKDTLLYYLFGLLIILPLSGPPLAGLTYIARNYARDEHAWLWGDFMAQMKINWKQSAIMMFILAVVLLLGFYALQAYAILVEANSWVGIARTLFIVFFCLFIASYMYVFPMLVTYKLSIWKIIKNSLILAFGRLPFTLLFGFMAIFPVLLALLLFMMFGQVEGSPMLLYIGIGLIIYYFLLGFSFAAFIVNSYTNATFDKMMKADEEPPQDDAGREVKP
jgi:uncharacterized membrane protein YesL